MTWHLTSDWVEAYASGGLSLQQVWSVEAHIDQCGECRSAVSSSYGDESRLEAIWIATIEQVDVPRSRMIERVLTFVGVPDHVTRLLVATPSLTTPWLLAVAGVLGFGLAMAWGSAGDSQTAARTGLLPFLLLAPLVPLAGVATAFGPGVDPTYEVASAAPFYGFRLLLIRTVAVVATSLAVAVGFALLLPNAGLLAAAWILPSIMLAVTALAIGTFTPLLTASGISAVLWLVGVTTLEAGPRDLVAFGWVGQLLFFTVLAASTIVLLIRREVFEKGGAT